LRQADRLEAQREHAEQQTGIFAYELVPILGEIRLAA